MTPHPHTPSRSTPPPESGEGKASRVESSPMTRDAGVSPDPLGFDLYRLDCAVEAIRGVEISPDDRAQLVRVTNNLMDLLA